MKALLLFLTLLVSKAFLAQTTSVEILSQGKKIQLHVGDTIQLGMGSNQDGSFMYVRKGATDFAGKEVALRKMQVRKIKYYKRLNQYTVFLKSKAAGWLYFELIDGTTCQALERKELVLE